MIFVPRRNIYTRRPYWQRGSVSVTPFANAAQQSVSGGVVTVSGETGISSVGAGNQTVRVDFLQDGTIDKFETQSGSTQLDVATDWIIPNTGADSTFDVRHISPTGDPFDISAAAVNVWVNLGSNRSWGYIDTDPSAFAIQNGGATFQIRKDGGAVIDSAIYSMLANRTS